MTRDRFFHHVSIYAVTDWLDCGWMVVLPNRGMHHHANGLLMEWLCDCKLARPR